MTKDITELFIDLTKCCFERHIELSYVIDNTGKEHNSIVLVNENNKNIVKILMNDMDEKDFPDKMLAVLTQVKTISL
jgi:hypothetical protein